MQSSEPTQWWLYRVALERFKAAFRADIELQPFTVLIGRNGSGKSTLLEALQWLDTAIRRDIREACDRYYGIRDLINKREKLEQPYFTMHLDWRPRNTGATEMRYRLCIEESRQSQPPQPQVREETLSYHHQGDATELVVTGFQGRRAIFDGSTEEMVDDDTGKTTMVAALLGIDRDERLALRDVRYSTEEAHFITDFWSRAVFLRLSPSRLAQSSSVLRKSFEPILDEEGQTLPALLHELGDEQREELITNLRELLPDIERFDVSRPDIGQKSYYTLYERMRTPDQRDEAVAIPAWMLSEGTRRLTALLALLVRDPPPSLLCIEELENGLDPWTVRALLQHLQAAVDRGTQVIVTTHSPWVLDAVPMDSIIQVRRINGETRYEHFASRPEIRAFDPSIPAGTRYIHEAE